MKYLSILSLMTAFAAFSSDASAVTAPANTEIKVTMQGESCLTADCGAAMKNAFEQNCKTTALDINAKDQTINVQAECDLDKTKADITNTNKCTGCTLDINIQNK